MADQVDTLVRAAGELSIERRADKDRWVHLSLCVLDAVFSIGARYSGVTKVCHWVIRPPRVNAATPHRPPLRPLVGHHRMPTCCLTAANGTSGRPGLPLASVE